MPRNGLILMTALGLALQPAAGSAKTEVHFHKREFRHFEEGVLLLKTGKDEEAYPRFKKSLDESFILQDYSLLFMASISSKIKEYEKAKRYLDMAMAANEPSTIPFVNKLKGEIALTEGDYKGAFASFLAYFSDSGIDKSPPTAFRDYALGFEKAEAGAEDEGAFYGHLAGFAALHDTSLSESDSLRSFEEIFSINGYHRELAGMLEAKGDLEGAIKLARDMLIFSERPSVWFAAVERLAQKRKDYRLKIRILEEQFRRSKDEETKASISFETGMALLNANDLKRAIDFFSMSASMSSKSLLILKSLYYKGRVYEDLKDVPKALLNYRKAAKIKAQTEDEIDYTVKSLFRAGWINYLAGNYAWAAKSFETLIKRFGLRLSEEGYPFWLAVTLFKQDKKERAKELFRALYTSFPLSYYGVMSAIALKNNFNLEPELTSFSMVDLVEKLSPENERLIDRAVLLYSVGLPEFAKSESQRIRSDYSNIKELYLTAVISVLFDDNRRAISLVDYIISRKTGWPDEEILKLYYPVKFMNFISDYSARENVDPFLIMSIIRQESVFKTDAVSKARAMGLMQVIPSLGVRKAKELELGEISETDLLNPEINIKVGVSHFVELIEKFKGNLAYAIAAYNSSEAKVKEWIERSPKRPILEFIEDIPYFETRKYVKMNLRNYLNYLRIYTDTDWRRVTFE